MALKNTYTAAIRQVYPYFTTQPSGNTFVGKWGIDTKYLTVTELTIATILTNTDVSSNFKNIDSTYAVPPSDWLYYYAYGDSNAGDNQLPNQNYVQAVTDSTDNAFYRWQYIPMNAAGKRLYAPSRYFFVYNVDKAGSNAETHGRLECWRSTMNANNFPHQLEINSSSSYFADLVKQPRVVAASNDGATSIPSFIKLDFPLNCKAVTGARTYMSGVNGWDSGYNWSQIEGENIFYTYWIRPTQYAFRSNHAGILLAELPILGEPPAGFAKYGSSGTEEARFEVAGVSSVYYVHQIYLADHFTVHHNKATVGNIGTISNRKFIHLAQDCYGLSYFTPEISNLAGVYYYEMATEYTLAAPRVSSRTDAGNYKRTVKVWNDNDIGLVLFYTANKCNSTSPSSWGSPSNTSGGQLAAVFVAPQSSVTLTIGDRANFDDKYIGFFFNGNYRSVINLSSSATASINKNYDVTTKTSSTEAAGASVSAPLLVGVSYSTSDTQDSVSYRSTAGGSGTLGRTIAWSSSNPLYYRLATYISEDPTVTLKNNYTTSGSPGK